MASELTIEFEFKNQRFKDAAKGLAAFGKSVEVSWSKLPPVLKRELKDYLDSVALALAKRHGNPYPGGTTTNSLSRRSGELIKTFAESVKVYGDSLEAIQGEIGSSVVGRTHEFGATIVPKKAKYLTIPLPYALNANGTPKRKSAKEWENTFIIRSKHDNLLICIKQGGTLIPLYVLKKKVTIPPRLNMGTTLRAGIPYFVDRAMSAMLDTMHAEMKPNA